MLRLESKTGWWLITHPDHAHLAGEFAEHWGNDLFRRPEPRAEVLLGVRSHDDGWAVRDAAPSITRQHLPSAFSVELVGKYSAFEEIDLEDYLAVRNRAVLLIAEREPYAAVLISMHTCNLLTERADRSTIASAQLPLLDRFIAAQLALQHGLLAEVRAGGRFAEAFTSTDTIVEHFRLLQACDNLSLLSCVDYKNPATLLHPLPLTNGEATEVKVTSIGERSYRLSPYPFAQKELSFQLKARHVDGKQFPASEDLQEKFAAAPVEMLEVKISS